MAVHLELTTQVYMTETADSKEKIPRFSNCSFCLLLWTVESICTNYVGMWDGSQWCPLFFLATESPLKMMKNAM